jgi:acyl-coenzyme A synthetase/AMP-(fatty) acid ligase
VTQPITTETVDSVFRDIAARFTDRVAAFDENGTHTYAELDCLADRFAGTLLELASPAHAPVGILMRRNALATAATLGVLRAGRICNPLDPSLPEARLASMIESAGPGVVLTDDANHGLAQRICPSGQTIVNVDAGLADRSTAPRHHRVKHDAPAWLSYTSGTTSTPKGILQTNRSTLFAFRNYINRTGITPRDRVAIIHFRHLDEFAPLLAGATIGFYDLYARTPSHWLQWLNEARITLLPIVPTALRVLLNACGPGVVAEIVRVFGEQCVLLNWLASNEMAVASFSIRAGEARELDRIPAGEVLDGITIRIVDDDRCPVPAGHTGEIAVTGRCMFPGYWEQPALTAARIETDPQDPASRTFYTGDMGRMDASGRLVFAGRKDRMAKIHGFRVEPADVESALLDIDGVDETAVATWTEPEAGSILVAYVVATEALLPSLGDLRRKLLNAMPAFMIPTYFFVLDRLPRSASGKVSLKELPVVTNADRSRYNVLNGMPPDNRRGNPERGA